MAQMVARHAFRYAGRRLAIGETFDTKSERDAVLLESAGRAKRTNVAAEKVAKRRGRPRKTEYVAEAIDGLAPEDRAIVDEYAAPDRFYQRRDLEAE